MSSPQLFSDRDAESRIADLAKEYKAASPFPHVVFDGLFNLDVLRSVASEFPESDWIQYDTTSEIKLALEDESKMGPVTRAVIHELNSQRFMKFLEGVTGISGLIPDPYLRGAGLHQIHRGGFLKVHTDFDKHKFMNLDRRLNVLIYLNDNWEESYGGHLQLWDTEMTQCETSVLPVLGRCVIFLTNDYSLHGHPEPLTCPEDRSRRSIAMYYYTNGRPAGEVKATHSTVFFNRPEDAPEQVSAKARLAGVAKRWLPPVLTDALKKH